MKNVYDCNRSISLISEAETYGYSLAALLWFWGLVFPVGHLLEINCVAAWRKSQRTKKCGEEHTGCPVNFNYHLWFANDRFLQVNDFINNWNLWKAKYCDIKHYPLILDKMQWTYTFEELSCRRAQRGFAVFTCCLVWVNSCIEHCTTGNDLSHFSFIKLILTPLFLVNVGNVFFKSFVSVKINRVVFNLYFDGKELHCIVIPFECRSIFAAGLFYFNKTEVFLLIHWHQTTSHHWWTIQLVVTWHNLISKW